ncbi:MAG: T9SS type A sorting domain-containing protein, partial [Bacteroidales bacterium]|nr:T9SS type A sorting domain-containing protein [Bacteroidales bacterium]
MMYKTVADIHTQGGIWNSQVVVVDAKESHAPMLTAKATITYPCRNKLKLMAGVATNPEATEPEYVIQFPMFDFQGGCNPMQGGSGGSTIEIGLDLNLLLEYVEPGETAKYFFMIVENDPSNSSQGMINSLELIDYTGDEPLSLGSLYNNVPIQNNTTTFLEVVATVNYDPVNVLTDEIPPLNLYAANSVQLEAEGGSEPYNWYLLETYDTTNSVTTFPSVLGEQVTVSNNNDGTGAIDLPFEFPFYGKKYNRIYAAVDGFIMFEPSEVTWPYYVAGKSYLIQNKIIAPSLSKPFYVNPSSGDGIWMQTGQGYIIVSWKLSVYGQSGNSEVSMAAKLHEDGKIEFFYGTHLAASFIAKFAGISAGDGINNVILNKTGTFTPLVSQHTVFEPQQAYNDITLSKRGLLQAEIYDYFPGQSLKVLVADNNNIRKTATLELQLEGLLMNYTVQSGGNEIIEFGETFSLDLNLQNINSFDLEAGSLTLQSEDSFITINNGQIDIPSLVAGESFLAQDIFSVEVSTQVPNAHTAEFTLSYESVSGSWSRPLRLKIYAPDLAVMTTNINDGQNGILEPGETANLIVSLQNKGGARLNMLQAIISSEHPDLTILSSTTTADFLHPQQNWDAIFQIYLSETAEPMQVVDILLQIQAENNYHFSVNIPILTSLIVENFETGDFSLYSWEMAGENPWFITTTTPYEGAYSARSGAIGHNSFSTMALSYDVAYPDTLSFFYKVSSENNYDYLKFSVNGLPIAQWSGEKPWSRAAYLVQAGEQTFRWRYEKDLSVVAGSDCAWVDYIVLPAKKIYTSIDETDRNDIFSLDVSPNPTAERLQIKVSAMQSSTFSIYVTDLHGRILYKTDENATANGSYTYYPDLNNMTVGSMLVILRSGQQTIVKKVIRTGR